MKIRFLCVVVLVACSVPADAQKNTDEVYAVIQRLFEGMKKGDSSLVSRELMPGTRLYSVATGKDGRPVLHQDEVSGWLASVASPHEQAYNEEIWDPHIRVDGNLAQVWVSYAFYLGDTYSHCGVDAFQLFYDGNAWKIFHIADTRRRECPIPDDIKMKHQ